MHFFCSLVFVIIILLYYPGKVSLPTCVYGGVVTNYHVHNYKRQLHVYVLGIVVVFCCFFFVDVLFTRKGVYMYARTRGTGTYTFPAPVLYTAKVTITKQSQIVHHHPRDNTYVSNN